MGNNEDKDTVFCFDAETGKTVWTFSYPQKLDPKYYEGGALSSPTVSDSKLYTVSKDGKAFCFDAGTGKVIWQKDFIGDMGFKRTSWGFSGSPLVLDNIVVYNVGTKGIAVDKNNGETAWENGKEPGGYATLVPYTSSDSKRCLALFASKEIIGLEAVTGKELWKHEWVTKYDVNAADPVIADNMIFISSGYSKGCALLKIDNSTVTEIWKNKNMVNKMNGCVLWNNHLYGVSENGSLKCLDLKSGSVIWEEKGFGQGSLSMADGKLLVLGEEGNLVCADATPDGYKPISKAVVLSGRCWVVPVLANGRIYTHNSKGKTVCLDVK